jgi:hypothetical protein
MSDSYMQDTGIARYHNLFIAPVEGMQTGTRRRPAVFGTILRFILNDFVRSPWPVVNLLAIAGVQLFLFNYSPDRGHFFGVEYALALALGVINAAALFSRANRPESYAIFARPVSRAAFTGAIMLVSWLLAVLAHVVSGVAVVMRFGPVFVQTPAAGPVPPADAVTAFLNGSLPVVAGSALAVTLMSLLSAFVSPPGVRLGVLAVLAVLVMSFDSRNFPVEPLRPYLQHLPPVLAPIAGALKYATEPPADAVAVASLIAVGVYALVLAVVVLLISGNRELVLD